MSRVIKSDQAPIIKSLDIDITEAVTGDFSSLQERISTCIKSKLSKLSRTSVSDWNAKSPYLDVETLDTFGDPYTQITATVYRYETDGEREVREAAEREKIEKAEKKEKKAKTKKEERERKQYERLKKKFEGKRK